MLGRGEFRKYFQISAIRQHKQDYFTFVDPRVNKWRKVNQNFQIYSFLATENLTERIKIM